MAAPIEIADYDPAWPQTFQTIRSKVSSCLHELVSRVEHVGSTAVPGLAAKPIVDMDVLLADLGDLTEAIVRLERLGYRHQGNLGIEGREAFVPPADVPNHHLYVCLSDTGEFRRHVALRDYLRTHPDAAREYEDLKKCLSASFRDDPDSYTEGKTTFIEATLTRAAGAD